MSWHYDDDPNRPSRAELQREEFEDWLAETYEVRYASFCGIYHLDPEDVGSALLYEEFWWEEIHPDL